MHAICTVFEDEEDSYESWNNRCILVFQSTFWPVCFRMAVLICLLPCAVLCPPSPTHWVDVQLVLLRCLYGDYHRPLFSGGIDTDINKSFQFPWLPAVCSLCSFQKLTKQWRGAWHRVAVKCCVVRVLGHRCEVYNNTASLYLERGYGSCRASLSYCLPRL